MKAFCSKYPRLSLVTLSILLSIVVVLVSCSLASFLYPSIAMQPYYNDPSTFVIMGKELASGKLPYREVFDHKGLYIFYVTFLYAYLGKFWIFMFMVSCMAVSIVFYVLTMKLLEFNKRTIVFGLLFFVSLYTFFAQFPGDADLIVMVGMIMMYFYIKGYKGNNDKHYLNACILAGVSAGIALNIRPSDAMLGFAFMVFYIVKRIKEKKYLLMFRDCALCILALGLTALPAYIHAYCSHFIRAMVDAVFFSNLKYLGSASDKSVVLVWMSRFIVLGIFGGLLLLWFFKRKEYQFEESLFIVTISIVLFIVQFAIALFAHYLISVSGFICLTLTIVMSKYHLLDEEKKTSKPLTIAITGVFGLALLFNPVLCLTHHQLDKGDIAYVKESISIEDRKAHTFLFSTYPGLYLNTGISVIYPDFNAQTYHMKLSKEYTEENMSAFVQSETCHYLVTRKKEVATATRLFGTANYVEIANNTGLPTTIVIYHHVI